MGGCQPAPRPESGRTLRASGPASLYRGRLFAPAGDIPTAKDHPADFGRNQRCAEIGGELAGIIETAHLRGAQRDFGCGNIALQLVLPRRADQRRGDARTRHHQCQRAVADIRRTIAADLAARIARDIADGALPADTDAAALAGIVVALIQGMSVLARDGASRVTLQAVAKTAMKAWPSAPE